VVTELSKFIDWPETGFEEIGALTMVNGITLPRADFWTKINLQNPGHHFPDRRFVLASIGLGHNCRVEGKERPPKHWAAFSLNARVLGPT
jgi:hypothetical protein